MYSYLNKDVIAHKYAVSGKKDRERDRERKRERKRVKHNSDRGKEAIEKKEQ